jgi:hypothetical protein
MSSQNIRDACVVIANSLLLTAALSSMPSCSDDAKSTDHGAADSGSSSKDEQSDAGHETDSHNESGKAGAGDDSKSDAAAKATEPLKLKVEVPGVQPGEEKTQCVQLRLPNQAEVNITKIHNTITTGSHHFIVTALTDKNAQETELTQCRAFAGALAGAPLAITQKHDDLVTLPEGIGYHLNSNQVMNLELHYINTTDRVLDIVAETELIAADGAAKLQDGSVMLMGTAKLNIPAHETWKTQPTFLKLPAGMEDVQFFAITGHTHHFGTDVNVHTADAGKQPVDELYHPERFDWEAPEMKQLAPQARVPKDGGFLLQCEWNNTSDSAVKFGESATAEMCFFWGYYFPKKDVISLVLDDMDQTKLKASTARPPGANAMPMSMQMP